MPAPAEPKASGKKGRRRGRAKAKDGLTGEQCLLQLLGSETLSTAEINKRWKASGRKGAANNQLGFLVNDGKIKRTNIEGGRGSAYAAK